MLRELQGVRGSYRMDPLGNRVADRVGQTSDAVTGMFERQAPDVMPQLNAANAAFSRMQPVEDAVLAAGNQGGRFMPSQLGRTVISNTKKFGGKHAAARGDRAFMDLQRNAQDVLPSVIPDSGTMGRAAILPGALGFIGAGGGAATAEDGEGAKGAGIGLGGGLALSAALASPYLARAPSSNCWLAGVRLPSKRWAAW